MNKMIKVEIAYALPLEQKIITVMVEEGATIETVIQRSGILAIFPEIHLSKQPVGIFSKQRPLSDLVKENDRVEIYRPLSMDPKEARRKKAKAKRKS